MGFGELAAVGDAEAEIPEEAVLEAVDPAVDRERLLPGPGVLDHGGLAEVGYLLDDVQLAEPVGAGFLIGEGIQEDPVLALDVLDVAQPVVDEAVAVALMAARTPPQP